MQSKPWSNDSEQMATWSPTLSEESIMRYTDTYQPCCQQRRDSDAVTCCAPYSQSILRFGTSRAFGCYLQVDILQHLGCSLNVASCYGAFEESTCVGVVLELCSGGELWSSIKFGEYTERGGWAASVPIAAAAARTFLKQLICACNIGVILFSCWSLAHHTHATTCPLACICFPWNCSLVNLDACM